ncbi:PREDICTED: 39S ribosomal protein L18, mitochondrial [Nicrophorus vespilloides]|uniref:39S ribosomal protein L18, mitochondrial n=1 Tax=Nicrophorus vespilloides TaxID=110193 RepID=A0ABM1NEA6_NICVS|nr:PREDICTED: 39S ribosomal protein L18, mitochondrial [Nicrophorus vespilloides]
MSFLKFVPKRYLSNDAIKPMLTNRNPRNLERMRIGYKPDGYHLENDVRNYWHKLNLDVSARYVSASVHHFKNGEVLSASTKEWAIKKQLYRNNDAAAFKNLGRVLAQRCMETGLTELHSDIETKNPDGKVALFLNALQESGITLKEPIQYKKPRAWDQERPEKSWEIQ